MECFTSIDCRAGRWHYCVPGQPLHTGLAWPGEFAPPGAEDRDAEVGRTAVACHLSDKCHVGGHLRTGSGRNHEFRTCAGHRQNHH